MLTTAAVLLVVAGCGEDSDLPPTAPVVPVLVAPTTNPQVLGGRVSDGHFPLAGVTVELVKGFGTGTTTTTASDGSYRLLTVHGHEGELVIRASREGFSPATEYRVVRPNDPRLSAVNFTLKPVAFGNIAGEWRMTFEVSPSCEGLPPASRVRRYAATIDQNGSLANILLRPPSDSFANPYASVDATSVRIGFDCYWMECLIERVESGEVLGLTGVATLVFDPNHMTGLLDGTVTIYPAGRWEVPSGPTCTRTDHRLTLERANASR